MGEHVVRSVYSRQSNLLKGIMQLYGITQFQCDVTYGAGGFYKDDIPKPLYRIDINPKSADVIPGDCTNLRQYFGDCKFDNVVFDPPFLTYIKNDADPDKENDTIMGKRFSGYDKYTHLKNHYVASLYEIHRILKPEGLLIFKCQDLVHHHSLHCTHINVIDWAKTIGFELLDLFILTATHRMDAPNRKGTQKHARIHHCYFLVFRREP